MFNDPGILVLKEGYKQPISARKGYGSITHEDEGSKLFWYHPSSQTEKAMIKLANAS